MTCPACGRDQLVEVLPPSHGIRRLSCERCGVVSSDPMAHPGADFYEGGAIYEFRDHQEDFVPPAPDQLPEDWRYRTFLELCGDQGKLLDLGCGEGTFLATAAQAGWQVEGIDLDRRGVKIAQQVYGLTGVRHGDVLADELPADGSFDAVTALDFLEHVPDPAALVARMRRGLKPGGRALIFVPHLDRWPQIFDPEVDAPPHHLTLWTAEGCRALFEGAGLVDVEVREKPLTVQDVWMHWRWRTMRARGHGRRRFLDYPAYAAVVALVAVGRALGLARGHALLAVGREPGG